MDALFLILKLAVKRRICLSSPMKLIALLLLFTVSLHAEDWTIAGKTYQNVTVGQVEADCVHIMYSDGIGRIMIADMPPELQIRFKFDPAAAKEASDTRSKAFADAMASLPTQSKPVEVTPPVPARAPSKPVVDTSLIQSQIVSLQADIDQKKAIMKHEGESLTSNGNRSGNGFRDAIADDQSRINVLKAQLH